MFSDNELKEFLELLWAFGMATGLSNRALGKVLAVDAGTLNRWYRIRRGEATGTAVRSLVEPVQRKINYLNERSAITGLYAAIEFEKTREKIHILRRELDQRPR